MKNLVRAFVFALTFAGTAAYTTTSSSSTVPVVKPRLSFYPIPVCPPNDPHACGMGR